MGRGGLGEGGVGFQSFIFSKLYFSFLNQFLFLPPQAPQPPHYLFYDKKNINKNKKRMGNGKGES